MKEGYDKDRDLERAFIPNMRTILADHFIVIDPVQDVECGTDFLTFSLKPLRVAARLRRYRYMKFSNQFTIRYSRPSGVRTEIHKIMDGDVDFLLYGFIDQDEKRIIQYFIGDLKVFRNHPEIRPVDIKENDPPDSELAIYRIDQFPSNFVVKSWPANPITNDTTEVIKTERKLTPSDFM